MKKLILLFVILNVVICSQPRRQQEKFSSPQLLKPTISVVPVSDTTASVYFLYRIPYKLLVFEKDGNNYTASLRIMVEVMKDDELVVRNFKDRKVVVDNFKITQSKAASVEGVVDFKLDADEYDFVGTMNDLNSDKEIKISSDHVNLSESIKNGVFNPIVVNFNDKNCNENNYPSIVNHSGSIPFSSQDYQLVIPIADTTVRELYIEMKNNDADSIIKSISESYIADIGITDCGNKLYLGENNSNLKTKNFILRNFTNKLSEGIVKLDIKKSENDESIVYPVNIIWIDKPISLRNPEFAIEMIQYIEGDSVVDNMLDEDEEDYNDELFDYWKKYDPTPDTKYNELMSEFYSRIDYAALEFRGLAKKTGVSTDRGKVYIKYGKPDKVERSSDEYGYVVETWIYANSRQKFVFVDKDGTGNFILIEG